MQTAFNIISGIDREEVFLNDVQSYFHETGRRPIYANKFYYRFPINISNFRSLLNDITQNDIFTSLKLLGENNQLSYEKIINAGSSEDDVEIVSESYSEDDYEEPPFQTKYISNYSETEEEELIYSTKRFYGDGKNYIYLTINSHGIEITIFSNEHEEGYYLNLIKDLKRLTSDLKVPERKAKISFICFNGHHFYLEDMDIKFVNNELLVDNYNDDLLSKLDELNASLSDSDSNGLYLFHGNPGTGKSYFIRNLISNLKKDLIYIPPSMAEKISNPAFLTFMLKLPNKILLIEDAETILKNRESGGSDAISNILNITEGIIGDALKLKVICTFNTDYENLDSALLRSGRLKFKYEFKELEVDKAKALFTKLHGNENVDKITSPMTLADVYEGKL